MKNKSLVENFSELNAVVKNYVEARIELAKAQLLEKITRVGTYFMSLIVSVVVIASMLLLLTFSFSFWYGDLYGNVYEGFLIAAGFYAVTGIVIYLFRQSIFANHIVRNVGRIFFAHHKTETEHQTVEEEEK